MREIKFRAWDTHYKLMVNDVSVYHNADIIGIPYAGDGPYTTEMIDESTYLAEGESDWLYILSNFELMQFTGLNDKNGEEIYEDDLLSEKDGTIWRVRWWNGSFWFVNVEDESNLNTYDWLINNKSRGSNFWEDGQYNVIGNIYENPELLKP